ncbi:hypothetical protein DPMN_115193 [Dreissena polymorpha]|uniref:Uncharacterized protein n=1 Tax=Dreissena polymorpha TaxID=45954 RepID=A0A9D4KLI2_DREPO|nr:hypothetical protein DPMN_115193 [Dreissena polymorpha]
MSDVKVIFKQNVPPSRSLTSIGRAFQTFFGNGVIRVIVEDDRDISTIALFSWTDSKTM